MDELIEAVTPLLQWMKQNCSPHEKVIVDLESVQLLHKEIELEITFDPLRL